MMKKRWYAHEDKEDGKDNVRRWKMRQVGCNSAEKRNKYAKDLQSRMTVISQGTHWSYQGKGRAKNQKGWYKVYIRNS